ncbi:unnamed protein product [Prunus armeniaca]
MDTMDEIRVDFLPSDSIYFIVGIINKKLDVNQFQNVHSCRSGLSDFCLGLLKRGIQVPVSTAEIALKNLGGRLTAINQQEIDVVNDHFWSVHFLQKWGTRKLEGFSIHSYIVRDLDGTGNKRENPETNPRRH